MTLMLVFLAAFALVGLLRDRAQVRDLLVGTIVLALTATLWLKNL